MQIRKLRKWNMYGIIYTVHVPLCSIHFLISLIDKKSSFPMLYNPTFLYTFVFSISWLLKPAMYAYKYRLAFLSETNRWLSINYQTKKVCHFDTPPSIPQRLFCLGLQVFHPDMSQYILEFKNQIRMERSYILLFCHIVYHVI